MKEVPISDRSNFAVAKKSSEAEGAKDFLDVAGIVVGFAKEAKTASVTAGKASTVDELFSQIFLGRFQEGFNILGCGCCVAALELNGLAQPGKSAHCQAARCGVGSEKISDQEVASLELFEILVNDETDKKVSLGFFLFCRGKAVKCFDQDFISRPVADFVDEILLGLGNGPGFADGGASL